MVPGCYREGISEKHHRGLIVRADGYSGSLSVRLTVGIGDHR